MVRFLHKRTRNKDERLNEGAKWRKSLGYLTD